NGILDSNWLQAHAADKSYVRSTNGTGPYMLKEWVSGDHLTMTANPNYWGDVKPTATTLIFKWEDDAAKRLQEVQAGTAAGVDDVGTDNYHSVQNDSTLKLINRHAFTILH